MALSSGSAYLQFYFVTSLWLVSSCSLFLSWCHYWMMNEPTDLSMRLKLDLPCTTKTWKSTRTSIWREGCGLRFCTYFNHVHYDIDGRKQQICVLCTHALTLLFCWWAVGSKKAINKNVVEQFVDGVHEVQAHHLCSPWQFNHLYFIAQFTSDIWYISGQDKVVTDALSRV
jgi:hypothetical protein